MQKMQKTHCVLVGLISSLRKPCQNRCTVTLNHPPLRSCSQHCIESTRSSGSDSFLSPSVQSQCAAIHLINMNISAILLVIGSQQTAQVRDGHHSSHHNFLPFQCMPPAAACSFIFADASHGQPGFGVAVEAYIDWGGSDRPCTLLSMTSLRRLGQVMFFSIRHPPKQNHKINSNFHGEENLRNSTSKFSRSTDSFQNLSPLHLSGFWSSAKRRGHASSGT